MTISSNHNINELRTHEMRAIEEEIRVNTKYMETDKTKLVRFKGQSSEDKYVAKQIEKLTKSIEERTELLNLLASRSEMVELGELDSELSSVVSENTKAFKEKFEEHMEKIKGIKQVKAEDAAMGKVYYLNEVREDKKGKEWYYNSCLRHLDKADDSLPEYMKRELERMPNNEGYIWKSVHYYGLKPPRGNTTTLYENRKGFKIIHRWSKLFYTVHEKPSRGIEALVSKTERKQKI